MCLPFSGLSCTVPFGFQFMDTRASNFDKPTKGYIGRSSTWILYRLAWMWLPGVNRPGGVREKYVSVPTDSLLAALITSPSSFFLSMHIVSSLCQWLNRSIIPSRSLAILLNACNPSQFSLFHTRWLLHFNPTIFLGFRFPRFLPPSFPPDFIRNCTLPFSLWSLHPFNPST